MKRFLSIFFPILFSNTIFIMSGVIDTAFLSHYSHVHLTALSVSLSVYMIVFVVGYGLDYDGLGRNLNHIYRAI